MIIVIFLSECLKLYSFSGFILKICGVAKSLTSIVLAVHKPVIIGMPRDHTPKKMFSRRAGRRVTAVGRCAAFFVWRANAHGVRKLCI